MNTIKSKIVVITLSMFFILLAVFAAFGYMYYRDTKTLVIEYASKDIDLFASNINKEVIKIEKNAKDLAMIGELYYKFDKDKNYANDVILQIFGNYPESLGGGIWFKPYIVNPSKKYDCVYAYRNKQNKILIDPEFETAGYDYINQKWHKEILSQVLKDNNIEWSSPYYEKEGSDSLMITAGSGIYNENGRIIGISTVDWEIDSVIKALSAIKPTPNTFVLFANPEKDYIIVSTDPYLNNDVLIGKSIKNIPWYRDNLSKVTYITYHNKKYVPYVKKFDNGMELIACLPKQELFGLILKSMIILCVLLAIISMFLTLFLYLGLKKNVLSPIGKLIFMANKISKGENDVEIKIEKPEEFAKLASTFDKMTKDIKAITKDKERINLELNVAKDIQMSYLPDTSNAFKDCAQFEIDASMIAAKEVGGDFYDFYFIDDSHFMFLIADVSGKGIPAALFMMTTKTLINDFSLNVHDPKEMISQINKKIYSNNKRGFFITLFAGIVDVNSGEMTCINCGHNPPLIKQNNGEYKYLELDSNVVLGVIENAEFNISKVNLNPGDIVFTYTDGVTEAINSEDLMYGEQRLLDCMNKTDSINLKTILSDVKQDVAEFTDLSPQSDDMTMLIFKYVGDGVKNFKALAIQENYKAFYTWLHNMCNQFKLSEELSYKIDMCAEEIYANIQFYAYGENNGNIEVNFSKENNIVTIEFIDSGILYNPLEKADPNIELAPQDRPSGGLGIFMVKQMTDEILYNRVDDKNILTLKFKI